MKTDYATIHIRLGCRGCFFADKEKVFKDHCCTFIGKLTTDKLGQCIERKEK